MKLISCDNCAIIIDGDKIEFPYDIYNSDGSVDETKAEWVNGDFVAKITCPVCSKPIFNM